MVPMLLILVTIIVSAVCQPYFVAYIDFPTCQGVGTSTADAVCLQKLGVPGYSDHKYNVINFAFYVSQSDTFYDATKPWVNPSLYFSQSFMNQIAGKSGASDAEFRAAVKAKYTEAGVKLLLSVGGGTDHPIRNGVNAATLASRVANYVKTYNFDGADIDWEEGDYLKSATASQWLITLTTNLREALGSSYIITHAPQAPYIGGSYNGGTNHYYNGGYLYVHQYVGDKIDWYNVQFYNQGSTTYGDFNELFVSSSGWCQTTAVYQMIQGSNPQNVAIPASKIVVGKFIRPNVDGSAGWISASNMKTIFTKAITNSDNLYPAWSTGFMIWQFPGDADQNFAWSNTVIEAWDSASSGSGSGSTGSTSTTTTTTTTTTTSSSGGSSGTLKVTNSGTSNYWWYGGIVSGFAGYTIDSFYITMSNGQWLKCSPSGSGYMGCQATVQLSYPLSVYITTTNGKCAYKSNLIENPYDGNVWDMGTNFESSCSAFTNEDSTSDGGSDESVIEIVGICAVVFVVLVLIFAGYCLYRRYKRKDIKDRKNMEKVVDDEEMAEKQETTETVDVEIPVTQTQE